MYGAKPFCVRSDQALLNKRAVRFEHLDAVVDSIADIDQYVFTFDHAVHRREVLRLHARLVRSLDRVAPQRSIWWLVTVGTPVPFVSTGLGIKDNDSPVSVSIGHVQLVGLGIDEHLRRSCEVLRIVARLRLLLPEPLHK